MVEFFVGHRGPPCSLTLVAFTSLGFFHRGGKRSFSTEPTHIRHTATIKADSLLVGLSVRHSLGLVVEGGDDLVAVLFRVVKSQAADREIDDFMTVPRSRPR